MRYLVTLCAALLTACASNKQAVAPKYDITEPQIKRWSASKYDLLYTYRIDARGDGFAKAAMDADNWCSQHGMMVAVRINPKCEQSEYADGVKVSYCVMSFKCQ